MHVVAIRWLVTASLCQNQHWLCLQGLVILIHVFCNDIQACAAKILKHGQLIMCKFIFGSELVEGSIVDHDVWVAKVWCIA